MMNKKHLKRVICAFLATTMFLSAATASFAQSTSGDTSIVSQISAELPDGYIYIDHADFEPLAGGDPYEPLNGFSAINGGVELSSEMVSGGVQAMKILPTSANDSKFYISKTYEAPISNAIVSFDMYVDGNSKRTADLKLSGGTHSDVHSRDIYIGINGGQIMCRATGTGTTNIQPYFDVETGWHNFELDYTQRGKVIFRVDGEELLTVTNEKYQDEFANFTKAEFVNFWEGTLSEAEAAVYIDNFQIIGPSPKAENVKVDDTNNTFTFDFFPEYDEARHYEYTMDGGQTYTTCSSNSIYIGNNAYDANMIGVRIITGDNSADTIYNNVAYTQSGEQQITFENEQDLLGYSPRNTTTIAISDEYSRSGLTSFAVASETEKTGNDYQYEMTKPVGEMVEGKVMTMWYYDLMEGVDFTEVNALVAPYDSNGTNSGKDGKIALGVYEHIDGGFDYYYVRDFGASASITNVPRSIGWHEFKWDYTVEGKCTVSIDGIEVYTGDSDGFDTIHYIDWWTKKQHVSYYDDWVISDTGTEIDVALAPTAAVTDDLNKTFGFTYVEGKDDISLYEYSVDGGETFVDCTANPQPLENTGHAVGDVMVRLKAVDGGYAGAVLRNNVAFNEPDAAFKASLQNLYNHANYFYEGDYTAESWTSANLDVELAKALEALESETGYADAQTALQTAVDKLVLDMDDNIIYGFEGEVEEKVLPFTIINGELDWGEYTNISNYGEQAYKLTTESVDGNQVARVMYTFAEPLENKYVEFAFRDLGTGSTHVKFIDSATGDGIHFFGTTSGYQYQIIDGGVYSNSTSTSMRSRADWYTLELNFTSDDGVVGTMDSRAWLDSDIISQFDTIDIRYDDATNYLTLDDFTIREKNEITSMTPNAESVTLGYYDTYEMNINNVVYETEKDYPTTDTVTYKSSDTSVVQVTTGGSIEPHGFGSATVTATASSGVTATVDVEAVDLKVEGIFISDSDYNDEPNKVTTLTIEPGYKKVVNAILTPTGVTERDVIWTSSDTTVITVNEGELTAVSEGVSTITAKSVDGNYTATLEVIVAEEIIDYSYEIFVATNGSDLTGDGSIDNPYATIQRARDEIRTLSGLLDNGATVYLREGTYTILDGIELDSQDSGINGVAVQYSSFMDEEVTLSGAIEIDSADMQKVTDEETLKMLPDASRDKVYYIDLSHLIDSHKSLQYVGHSINYTPWLEEDGFNVTNPYYSVTFDGSAQTLSRWPNVGQNVYSATYPGYTRINDVLHAGATPRNWKDDMMGNPAWIPPENRDKTDSFEIASDALSDRIANWYGIAKDGTNILDEDIWAVGYWQNDFSDQSVQIRWIDEFANGEYSIKSDVPSGYSVRSSQSYNRFYVYNVLQELDVAGEWYFDQDDYKLYYYPADSVDMSDNHTLKMAAMEDTMFTFNETNDITVSGLNVESVLGHAVEILGSDTVKYENATVRATELKVGIVDNSANGVLSFNSGFENCNFYDVNGGIEITGGDLHNLVSQGNYVTNCHFKNFATVNKSYNPAIALEEGVGNRISSCVIEDGPHNAITYSGNDHVMEFTEIFDVVKESKDQSAIYTGRNVLQRGSVVRNCYIHDIPKGTGNPNSAIYLDDCTAGLDIIDNTFENMGWGLFINGGRDNFIIDNEFINCTDSLVLNDWGYMGVGNMDLHGLGTITHPHTMVPTTYLWDDPTSVYGKYEHLWTIREDYIHHSKYNTFIGNTQVGGGSDLYYYMSRGVQANYRTVLDDWYFIKGNSN